MELKARLQSFIDRLINLSSNGTIHPELFEGDVDTLRDAVGLCVATQKVLDTLAGYRSQYRSYAARPNHNEMTTREVQQHSELTAIHSILMCPAECSPITESDTITVRLLKDVIRGQNHYKCEPSPQHTKPLDDDAVEPREIGRMAYEAAAKAIRNPLPWAGTNQIAWNVAAKAVLAWACHELDMEAEYGCPCNEDERVAWELTDKLRELGGLPRRDSVTPNDRAKGPAACGRSRLSAGFDGADSTEN